MRTYMTQTYKYLCVCTPASLYTTYSCCLQLQFDILQSLQCSRLFTSFAHPSNLLHAL
ncbi:hypothetical protein CC79DRAFT_1330435 [Sarocladium strictum]